MAEEWRSVVGYEGLYEVSSLGQVRSVDRVVRNCNGINRRFKGKLIKPSFSKRTGYLKLCLCKNGVIATKNVHRIVADAFLAEIPDKPIVDHINGVKTDNRAANLRYVNHVENSAAAYELGLIDREKISKESRERFLSLRLNKHNCRPVVRSDGMCFESISDAAHSIGCHHEAVRRVARGERNSCHGYGFKYADENN